MNRSTGATLLFVGCILIYLSVFGITGFGFRFALGGSFTDPFNTIDTTRWKITTDPVYSGRYYADGVLHFDWSTKPTGNTVQGWESVTFSSIALYDFSQGGSLTLDIVSMTGGTGNIRVFDLFLVDQPTGFSGATMVGVRKNAYAKYYCVFDYTKSPNIEFNKQTFVTYPGNLKIEVSTMGKLTFYVDGVQLLTGYSPPWSTLQLYVGMRAGVDWTYYGHLTVDNYQVVAGTTPPPPDTGNLKVIGYYDGNPVSCQAYYVGPQGTSATVTVPTTGYTWSSITTGSYTVYGTYTGIAKSQIATVVAGQTVTVQLNFGGTTPPPTETPDFLNQILQFIENTLNNTTVKSLMLVGGLGMVGLGAIGLFMPKRKQYSPPPPSSYY